MLAGLKYQDAQIRVSSIKAGNVFFMASPEARCENKAPDITKKKPA